MSKSIDETILSRNAKMEFVPQQMTTDTAVFYRGPGVWWSDSEERDYTHTSPNLYVRGGHSPSAQFVWGGLPLYKLVSNDTISVASHGANRNGVLQNVNGIFIDPSYDDLRDWYTTTSFAGVAERNYNAVDRNKVNVSGQPDFDISALIGGLIQLSMNLTGEDLFVNDLLYLGNVEELMSSPVKKLSDLQNVSIKEKYLNIHTNDDIVPIGFGKLGQRPLYSRKVSNDKFYEAVEQYEERKRRIFFKVTQECRAEGDKGPIGTITSWY